MDEDTSTQHCAPETSPPHQADLTRRERDFADVWRFKLDNGLRVWAHQRPRTGTLALLMQIPVGSRHETRQDNGVAHFVEHMVFTGTEKWPEERAVMDAIRDVGGYVNAFTGHEETVYHLHLKADDLDLGLEWLSEVLFRPTLSEEKFDKEHGVIMQEKGGEFGRLGRLFEWLENRNLGYDVFWAVRRRLFPGSMLLRPIIGTDDSLQGIDYQKVVDFYRRHYVPNNMTLIAVGDIELDSLQAAVEARFGGFLAGERPPEPEPIPVNPRPFDVRLHGPSINDRGQMLLGGVIGGIDHPDRYALWVLCELLDNQLTEEIRHKRGLVYGVSPHTVLYNDAGYLYIYTTADSDKFGEIQQVIEEHLRRVIDGEISEEAVEKAKAAIRGEAMLHLESNVSMGWWLSGDTLIVKDDEAEPVPNFFAGIAAVTAGDVQRVTRAYLAPEKRFRVIHRPALTPRRLRPVLAGVGAILAGSVAVLAARHYHRRSGLEQH